MSCRKQLKLNNGVKIGAGIALSNKVDDAESKAVDA